VLEDRTDEYRHRDLHAECDRDPNGEWPPGPKKKRRYGGVTFDREGQVLLREPKNHYDGFHWTFSKGRADPDEDPVDTALRETLEETGYRPSIVGHIPGAFRGGVTGSYNYFYIMVNDSLFDEAEMKKNGETSAVCWGSEEEARGLITLSTNQGGRQRDLATLAAAFEEFRKLQTD
jgi:8-oxo-dGTP pyrophosphatase MutT (NUDIX family)